MLELDDRPDVLATAVRAANRLTARWSSRLPADRSTAVSGAGVWPLLAFLAGAAAGPAREQLAASVGVPAADGATHARALLQALATTDGARTALATWHDPALPLAAWWRDNVPGDVARAWTGDPDVDRAAVQRWLGEASGGVLGDAPDWAGDAVLALSAALGVQLGWARRFADVPLGPRRGPWRGCALRGLARTSFSVDDVAVHETAHGRVTVVTLDTEQDVCVRLAAGRRRAAPGDVLAGALEAVRDGDEGVRLRPWLRAPATRVRRARRRRQGLSLTVPAFEVAASHDLLAEPDLSGLRAAGRDSARGHFPGLTPVPVAVARAEQHLRAELSADGFSAAALSTVQLRVTSAPPTAGLRVDVRFDRPFGFLVDDPSTGLVLLAGWVGEPPVR